jgi:limonene-1,2-epoxide hydrolase
MEAEINETVHEFLVAMARKGGEARVRDIGSEGMRELARKSAEVRRRNKIERLNKEAQKR